MGRGGQVLNLLHHSRRVGRPAHMLATGPGGRHTRTDTLADQGSFQFRHRPDDGEHGPPHGALGIDLVLHADEAHAQMVEFLERGQEVTHGPGEPVKLPDKDTLDLAVAGACHQGVELGTAHLPTRDGMITVDADNSQARTVRIGGQPILLQAQRLATTRRQAASSVPRRWTPASANRIDADLARGARSPEPIAGRARRDDRPRVGGHKGALVSLGTRATTFTLLARVARQTAAAVGASLQAPPRPWARCAVPTSTAGAARRSLTTGRWPGPALPALSWPGPDHAWPPVRMGWGAQRAPQRSRAGVPAPTL